MNEKISSGEVMAICVGIIFAMFPGFANSLILISSKNASLLSLGISFVLGFIPIFMIMYISMKIDTNFFKFSTENFKVFGYVLNILLLMLAIFTIFISTWLMMDFIISQFLTRNSYYLIAVFISIIWAFVVNQGIETLSRTIFLIFIISVTVIVLLLLTLIPYVDLNNLKPFVDVPFKKILNSSFVFLSTSISPIFYILGLKYITKDKKNFSRKILVSYIIASCLIFMILFFIISVYGIELGSILTYPVYGLFKKVQIFGFIERIENFAAMFLITAFFAQISYFVYVIKNNISYMFAIKSSIKQNILTYVIAIIIPIVSIYCFKNYSLSLYISYVPYVLVIFYVILIIYFVKCLFIRKNTS